MGSAGFGIPSQRKRVFVVASLYGDARDVLLSQVVPLPLGSWLSHTFGMPSDGSLDWFDEI